MNWLGNFFGRSGQRSRAKVTENECCLCQAQMVPKNTPADRYTWVCGSCASRPLQTRDDLRAVYDLVSRFYEERLHLDLSSWIKPADIILADEQMLYSADRNEVAQGRVHLLERRLPFLGYRQITGQKIYLLKGLYLLGAGGVLCHESFHIYSAIRNLNWSSIQEEGTANLASYLFLRAHPGELSERLSRSLLSSLDPVYGDGFRIARDNYKIAEYSFQRLLKMACS